MSKQYEVHRPFKHYSNDVITARKVGDVIDENDIDQADILSLIQHGRIALVGEEVSSDVPQPAEPQYREVKSLRDVVDSKDQVAVGGVANQKAVAASTETRGAKTTPDEPSAPVSKESVRTFDALNATAKEIRAEAKERGYNLGLTPNASKLRLAEAFNKASEA
ncbi:MAG TPA: hypothetical protein ENI23_00705 [bacterium]|nr:hypothetical protein [bacterium]